MLVSTRTPKAHITAGIWCLSHRGLGDLPRSSDAGGREAAASRCEDGRCWHLPFCSFLSDCTAAKTPKLAHGGLI